MVAALARRACPGAALALILPCESDPADRELAELVASRLEVPARVVDLTSTYRTLLAATGEEGSRLARGNLKARLRMATWYFFANQLNYLVLGGGNRSELETGYFTKYGDGGADLLPLGRLVKTQVYALAGYLGVPEAVLKRAPTAGLWAGQTDEAEMGLTYRELDAYLLTGEGPEAVRERVERMRRASRHKRRPPLRPRW